MESEAWAWPTVPLGSIATFRVGSAFKTEHQGGQSGDIPFIKVSDFSLPENSFQIRTANNWVSRAKANEIKAALHPPGATVFAKIGVALTYNRRRLLVRETALDNNLMSAAPINGKVSSEYLHFLLAHLDFNVIANGSALPYLNVSDLRNIEVGVPQPKVQEETVAMLMALQQRIDLLRQTNATLESIAQALFKSWFIDFDPVRAKAEGREPEGMDAATAALFPAEFEESIRGALPRGWRVGSILEVASLLSGGTPKTDNPAFWGGGIPWASAKDVSQCRDSVLVETERTISQAGLERSSTRIIPALASVIVARGATTGRMVMFADAMAMNQTCYALISKGDVPCALNLLLRNEVSGLVNAAHGSVFDTITTTTFSNSQCVLPPATLLERFESLVRPLVDRQISSVRSAQALASIRDTLLPRLISGKLRLPEAQAMMESTT
ncbi:MAG: hypothetical protein RIQ60_4374 [Pseudomonadota bacterium]|jgi:type I restriction enzyme S subunit